MKEDNEINKELIAKTIKKLKEGYSVTLLDPNDTTKYRRIELSKFEKEDDTTEKEIEEMKDLYYWGCGSAGEWSIIEDVERDLKTYPKLLMVDLKN